MYHVCTCICVLVVSTDMWVCTRVISLHYHNTLLTSIDNEWNKYIKEKQEGERIKTTADMGNEIQDKERERQREGERESWWKRYIVRIVKHRERTPSISAVFESLPLSSSEIRSGGKHDFSKRDHIGRSGKATSRNSRRRSRRAARTNVRRRSGEPTCVYHSLYAIFYIIIYLTSLLNYKYTYSNRACTRDIRRTFDLIKGFLRSPWFS